MKRSVLATRLLFFAVVLVSCEGESPIEPGPDTGPVTAYIDGDAFVAESVSVDNTQTVVVVTASEGGRTIRFEFPPLGTRNYLIGPGNPVVAEVAVGNATWRADDGQGGGSITVTEFIPGYLSGSFELTLEGDANPATLSVTNGRFLIIGF